MKKHSYIEISAATPASPSFLVVYYSAIRSCLGHVIGCCTILGGSEFKAHLCLLKPVGSKVSLTWLFASLEREKMFPATFLACPRYILGIKHRFLSLIYWCCGPCGTGITEERLSDMCSGWIKIGQVPSP